MPVIDRKRNARCVAPEWPRGQPAKSVRQNARMACRMPPGRDIESPPMKKTAHDACGPFQLSLAISLAIVACDDHFYRPATETAIDIWQSGVNYLKATT